LPVTDTAIYAGQTAKQRVRRKRERTRLAALAERSGMAALQASKIMCVHGHELSGGNLALRTRPNGVVWRECKACKRVRRRASARLRRLAQAAAA
jgi:hypothetical protein